jgi:hypothetical protein
MPTATDLNAITTNRRPAPPAQNQSAVIGCYVFEALLLLPLAVLVVVDAMRLVLR